MDDFDHVLLEHQIDEVVFALPKGSPLELEFYLLKCETMGVSVRILPASFDFSHPSLRVETIQGVPTLVHRDWNASASALLYKRMLDMEVGLVGFVIFLLLYPIVGPAIKLDFPVRCCSSIVGWRETAACFISTNFDL